MHCRLQKRTGILINRVMAGLPVRIQDQVKLVIIDFVSVVIVVSGLLSTEEKFLVERVFEIQDSIFGGHSLQLEI